MMACKCSSLPLPLPLTLPLTLIVSCGMMQEFISSGGFIEHSKYSPSCGRGRGRVRRRVRVRASG